MRNEKSILIKLICYLFLPFLINGELIAQRKSVDKTDNFNLVAKMFYENGESVNEELFISTLSQIHFGTGVEYNRTMKGKLNLGVGVYLYLENFRSISDRLLLPCNIVQIMDGDSDSYSTYVHTNNILWIGFGPNLQYEITTRLELFLGINFLQRLMNTNESFLNSCGNPTDIVENSDNVLFPSRQVRSELFLFYSINKLQMGLGLAFSPTKYDISGVNYSRFLQPGFSINYKI